MMRRFELMKRWMLLLVQMLLQQFITASWRWYGWGWCWWIELIMTVNAAHIYSLELAGRCNIQSLHHLEPVWHWEGRRGWVEETVVMIFLQQWLWSWIWWKTIGRNAPVNRATAWIWTLILLRRRVFATKATWAWLTFRRLLDEIEIQVERRWGELGCMTHWPRQRACSSVVRKWWIMLWSNVCIIASNRRRRKLYRHKALLVPICLLMECPECGQLVDISRISRRTKRTAHAVRWTFSRWGIYWAEITKVEWRPRWVHHWTWICRWARHQTTDARWRENVAAWDHWNGNTCTNCIDVKILCHWHGMRRCRCTMDLRNSLEEISTQIDPSIWALTVGTKAEFTRPLDERSTPRWTRYFRTSWQKSTIIAAAVLRSDAIALRFHQYTINSIFINYKLSVTWTMYMFYVGNVVGQRTRVDRLTILTSSWRPDPIQNRY